MIVFSPWSPILGRANDYLGRIGLITLLAVTVWIIQSNNRIEKVWASILWPSGFGCCGIT